VSSDHLVKLTWMLVSTHSFQLNNHTGDATTNTGETTLISRAYFTISQLEAHQESLLVLIFLRDPMSCSLLRLVRLPINSLKHCRRGNPSHSYTIHSRHALPRLTIAQIESTDSNSVEYAHPYIKLIAVEVFAHLQRQSFFLESEYLEGNSLRAKIEALEEGWGFSSRYKTLHDNSQASVEHFCNPESRAAWDLRAYYGVLMQ